MNDIRATLKTDFAQAGDILERPFRAVLSPKLVNNSRWNVGEHAFPTRFRLFFQPIAPRVRYIRTA